MRLFTRSLFLHVVLLLCAAAAFSQPVANFTANVTSGCAPLIVNFTSTSTGNPSSYQWNLGNGVTPTIANPSTSYNTPGTYTVTLTVSNGSGSNTKTVTGYITVYGPPIVTFSTPDTAGCPPHSATFINTSNPVVPGPATYNWNFGDGNSSTAQNPSHTWPTPGFYNITLTVTNSQGCATTVTKPGYIHTLTPPVASFTATPTAPCEAPATVNFTNTSTGTTALTSIWNLGAGPIVTTTNATYTYTAPGAYNVRLEVTDARGCKDTQLINNYINIGALQANFSGPLTACVGDSVYFTNTTTPTFTASSWDFGGTGTSAAANPGWVFYTPGTYNVKLVAFNNACTDTIIKQLTVHPQPVADFTFTPLQPCPAPQTIQFATTGNAVSYSWNFGDNTPLGSGANPTHTYAANGMYTVTLVATSVNGCKDTIQKLNYVKIYDLNLAALADKIGGCAPLTINFSSNTFSTIPTPPAVVSLPYPYPYGVASYSWNFGDNSPMDNTPTPTHVYVNPGIYTVTLNIITANGCTIGDTIEVRAGIVPNAAFTAQPTVICNKKTVTFTNSSTNATDYLWDFGDGASSAQSSPDHTYITPGVYTIRLIAYNNGCPDTALVPNMITVHFPKSDYNFAYSCDTNLLVKFTNLSISATSHMWYFGDGTSSTALDPHHTYPAIGVYNAMLVTFNSTTGCSDTMTRQMVLIDPVSTLTANDTAICKDDIVHFTAGMSGSIALGYEWYVNNAFQTDDSTTSYTRLFPNTGLYKIKVVIYDLHNCADSVVRNNYILVAKPNVDFVASPLIGCKPVLVNFTDNSTNTPGAFSTSRTWNFGDNTSATLPGATASHWYNAVNNFTIKLVVTDNVGCKDSLTKNQYVQVHKPVAAFTASTVNGCRNIAINFNNTSQNAVSAVWDFGDNTGAVTTVNASHAYAQAGTYTVRLIVTDTYGCKDTMTQTNFINIAAPDASFTQSDTLIICPPAIVQFTNTSTGATSYAWTFGTGNGAAIPNPSESYNTPNLYTVRLIATSQFGCKDTAFSTVNVLGYAGGISYTPILGCSPLTVQFSTTITNVTSMIWDFSDGITQPVGTTGTTTHTYTNPGGYLPKLILSDGLGCQNSTSGIDTIKVDDVIAGFTHAPFPACEGVDIVMQDTSFSFFSPITGHNWRFDNGQTSQAGNPTHNFGAAGTYPVQLVSTNANGCKDTVVRNVTVFPLPAISAGLDTVICVGDAATLLATGGVDYTWNANPTLSCTNCPNPVATPAAATSYVVVGTDANGCSNRDSIRVSLQSQTSSTVGSGGEMCEDDQFQLIASGAHRYEWTPPTGLDNTTIPNPKASPPVGDITYMVVAWEGSCAPDTNFVDITVHPKPEISAGADESIVSGNSVTLNASGAHTEKYVWAPAQTLSCDVCANPTASPMATTTYTVTGYSRFGCVDSDQVVVKVLCDQSQVFIPNSFTPNGDAQNDVFFPRGTGISKIQSLRVYTRWGEVVYERTGFDVNDESVGWDGTHKGNVLSPDIYVYVMEATCQNGETVVWKGDISIIR